MDKRILGVNQQVSKMLEKSEPNRNEKLREAMRQRGELMPLDIIPRVLFQGMQWFKSDINRGWKRDAPLVHLSACSPELVEEAIERAAQTIMPFPQWSTSAHPADIEAAPKIWRRLLDALLELHSVGAEETAGQKEHLEAGIDMDTGEAMIGGSAYRRGKQRRYAMTLARAMELMMTTSGGRQEVSYWLMQNSSMSEDLVAVEARYHYEISGKNYEPVILSRASAIEEAVHDALTRPGRLRPILPDDGVTRLGGAWVSGPIRWPRLRRLVGPPQPYLSERLSEERAEEIQSLDIPTWLKEAAHHNARQPASLEAGYVSPAGQIEMRRSIIAVESLKEAFSRSREMAHNLYRPLFQRCMA